MNRALGGNTKTVKSYGKRAKHTTNRVTSTWVLSSDSDSDAVPVRISSKSSKSTSIPPVVAHDDSTESAASSDTSSPPRVIPRQQALNQIKAKRRQQVDSVIQDKENVVVDSPVTHLVMVGGKQKQRPVIILPAFVKRASVEEGKGKGRVMLSDELSDEDEFGKAQSVRSPLQICSTNGSKTGETKGVKKEMVSSHNNLIAPTLIKPRRKVQSVPSRERRAATTIDEEKTRLSLPSRTATTSTKLNGSDLNQITTRLDSITLIDVAPPIDCVNTNATAHHPIGIIRAISTTPCSTPLRSSATTSTTLIATPPPATPIRRLPDATTHIFPSVLASLLAASSSPIPFDFTSFVAHAPLPFSDLSSWKKIGEASYSEVFAAKDVNGEEMVIKIIPVSTGSDARIGGEEEDELPYSSEWESVLREIEIGKSVGEGEGVEGFVKFRSSFIVQGVYPETLLAAWDTFKLAQRPVSEDQIRPDMLPANQVYALICLAHGGSDLERYKLKSWYEAASVFWQVVSICARGEDAMEFEHRDLHWGNILLKPVERDSPIESVSENITPSRNVVRTRTSASLESRGSGLGVTLIDFTLSRARLSDDRVACDPFSDDCIFDGEGDAQFDVYRSMRDHVGTDWKGFHPLTNIFWLHYLITKLLRCKNLKIPSHIVPIASPIRSPFRPRTARAPTTARRLTPAVNRRSRTLPTRKTLLEQTREREERSWYDMLMVIETKLTSAVSISKPVRKGKGKKGKGSEQDSVSNSTELIKLWVELFV